MKIKWSSTVRINSPMSKAIRIPGQPRGAIEKVIDALAARGITVAKDISFAGLCRTVSRLTGKQYSGDPTRIWTQLEEFYNGPLSQGLKVREFKPLNTSRYDKVLEEIKARE